MILTAHQPAYLPWLGYFDKIISSDIFIFLDTVQYEKNSFINRNRIKTPNGHIWLTIPIKTKGHILQTMKETEIDNRQNWKRKHLKTIYLNYRKSSEFGQLYPELEKLYDNEYILLADLCFDHLIFWLDKLKIHTKIIRSSEIPVKSRKSDLILEICKYFDANRYISGILGKNYLEENEFEKAGIRIEYQNYQHPFYPQLYGAFVPNMGIVDLCMNTDQFEFMKKGRI